MISEKGFRVLALISVLCGFVWSCGMIYWGLNDNGAISHLLKAIPLAIGIYITFYFVFLFCRLMFIEVKTFFL